MLPTFTRSTLALLAASAMAAVAAVTVGTAASAEPAAGAHAGPPYNFTTELMGYGGPAEPMKGQASIDKSRHGYQFRSGQQNGHLVVTRVNGGLRFADTGTDAWKKLAAACHRQKVQKGVAAVCRVPGNISERLPLLVEVWPRLGNDYTNASTLPATFAVTMLGDKGKDEAHFGAGPDFFNGFTGRDIIEGGAGDDWIRSGVGNDAVRGGAGNDDVVAKEGRDSVRGGDGDDRLWGGDGDDRLWGDAGADYLLCGNGHDSVTVDEGEHVYSNCEGVEQR